MAKVIFNENRCKGCELCINACPKKIIRLAERFNTVGYHPAEVPDQDQSQCISCGFCHRMCPHVAIEVYK
ncbi:MAG TPA: 4Fe-4S binding protein [Bacillota bacterium]|nr:4Fe-4S binding protein [Bacillota bacterium]